MKPHRIRVTHELVTAYDMLPKMHILVGLLIHLTPSIRLKLCVRDQREHPQKP